VGRHDFYSHHRRFNFDHPVAIEIGFKTNAARYSYDFTVVDADGNRYRGTATSTRITSRMASRCWRPATARSCKVQDGVSEEGPAR
jgi:hypothetical protein